MCSTDYTTLNALARDRGFLVQDVPGDGNCLFSAVALQLKQLGISTSSARLRQELVTYLHSNPLTHHGSSHFKNFISAAVVSDDPNNADTEAPNAVDQLLNSIEDQEVRQQQCWLHYLDRLQAGAWGDHM